MSKTTQELQEAVIRFAGDSGDGMQLTGGRFTETTAVFGNDLSTLPDFPAEIRAPAGSLAGVSAFQIKFSSKDIHTPGDAPNVLVAMNPAALKANKNWIKKGGTIIVNIDSFTKKDLQKAGYESSPLEDNSFEGFNIIQAPITKLTRESLKDSGSLSKAVRWSTTCTRSSASLTVRTSTLIPKRSRS